MSDKKITVIGGGLAGAEAALQLAKRGIKVELIECKPLKRTAAHHSDKFGELVCSNSLKSNLPSTASGMLKEELRILGCELISIADEVKVPAGSALAVDREKFADAVTLAVKQNANITVVSREMVDWDKNEFTIIATGPLTLAPFADKLMTEFNENGLHFFDAAAPIIDATSIDYSKTFSADRYGKGDGDYVNCPMEKEEYLAFHSALVNADCAVLKEFEKTDIFEGCMPVEAMAKRGVDTLRFGPLRPVGFRDNTGKRPYAVVQLRRENTAGEQFNIVGFQTNLKFLEQERVFRMIPALANAEFTRYGFMHRNTYINAPRILSSSFSTKKYPKTYIAGQLSGVEGYVESIMSGLVAAINVSRALSGKSAAVYPLTTITGALAAYLEKENANFQPMNANFGLLPPLAENIKDKTRKKTMLTERGLVDLKDALCDIL